MVFRSILQDQAILETGMIILRILKQNRGSEMILPLFMYPPVIKPGLENPLFLDDFPQLQNLHW